MSEGISLIDEAIAFLKRQRPVANLTFNNTLSEVASERLSYISYLYSVSYNNNETNIDIDLNGVDLNAYIQKRIEWENCCSETIVNSYDNARDAVLSIILDDSDVSRKNRCNLFKEDYKYIGLGVSPDSNVGIIMSLIFVGNIRDKNTAFYNGNYKYTYPVVNTSIGFNNYRKKESKYHSEDKDDDVSVIGNSKSKEKNLRIKEDNIEGIKEETIYNKYRLRDDGRAIKTKTKVLKLFNNECKVVEYENVLK